LRADIAARYVDAVLEIAVLGLLIESDLHGYELKKRIGELLGPWSSVSFGSLYPALARLERGGLLVSTAEPTASAEPAPMSGSLGAELAAYRARSQSRPATRRARKVYSVTEEGRSTLRSLLNDETGDDRSFALRVAFCRLLEPDERLSLFRRRRNSVAERVSHRHEGSASADRYRTRLLEFQDDRLARELAWLDDLIAGEVADDQPLGDDPALAPTGGNLR